MTRTRTFVLLTSLYLAQGLPFGFFTQAVPVLLRRDGASLEVVGASSLLALPWALKFLWAPVVDRFGSEQIGRRRSWLLPVQALTVAVVAALALADPTGAADRTAALELLAVGMLVTSLLAATQDIATDALAVEILSDRDRGLGNGIQVAAYRLGMIAGGGVLLAMFERLGWRNAFLVMAGLLVVTSLPIWLTSEPPRRSREPPPGFLDLVRALTQPTMYAWLVALCLFKLGDALASQMTKPMLVDAHLDLEQIAWLSGAGGSVAGLVGALIGGAATGFLGLRRSLVVFGLAQALGAAAWIVPATTGASPPVLWATTLLESLLGGTATAALFTAMMAASRPTAAATDYTVQACAVVFATGAASAASGAIAAELGYAGHFTLCAVLCVAGIAPAAWLAPSVVRVHAAGGAAKPSTG